MTTEQNNNQSADQIKAQIKRRQASIRQNAQRIEQALKKNKDNTTTNK